MIQLQHFREYELALDVKPGHCKMPVLETASTENASTDIGICRKATGKCRYWKLPVLKMPVLKMLVLKMPVLKTETILKKCRAN